MLLAISSFPGYGDLEVPTRSGWEGMTKAAETNIQSRDTKPDRVSQRHFPDDLNTHIERTAEAF